MLLIGEPNGLGHNPVVGMMEAQACCILSAIRTLDATGKRCLEGREATRRRHNDWLRQRLEQTACTGGCHSGYRNRPGRNVVIWPGTSFEFHWHTRRFKPQDSLWSRMLRPGSSTAQCL